MDYELGKIARPVAEDDTVVVEGDPYIIAHEKLTVVEGASMQYIGIATGLRKGHIKDTCSTVQGDGVDLPDDLVLLCQHKHNHKPEGGDSGSPVFQVEADGTTIQIAGIIFAKAPSFLPWNKNAWFSPVEGIRNEINPNSSLTCDGLGTTLNGSCGEPSGSSGGDGCEDDPFALEPVC